MKGDDFDTKQFLKERKAALLSMDEKKIRALLAKHSPDAPRSTGLTFWVGVHIARTGAADLPMWERAASKFWLHHFGFRAMDDGDVLPPITRAEQRKYFRRIEKFLARDFNITEVAG